LTAGDATPQDTRSMWQTRPSGERDRSRRVQSGGRSTVPLHDDPTHASGVDGEPGQFRSGQRSQGASAGPGGRETAMHVE